ncbi:MAG: hypothetical protein GY911_05320, partial [Actinomycetales bacterium]|nr:hypothetical protein [Actinomycetales bacterium]
MSKFESVVAAALAGVVVSGVAAQDAVQWRVEDGGNGHWYEFRMLPQECIELAEARVNGDGAHLATVRSDAENAFVDALIPNWSGVYSVAMLGAYQDEDAKSPEDGWHWLNGEPWDYTAWSPHNDQPNDDINGAEESAVVMYSTQHTPFGSWHDNTPACEFTTDVAWIIEWSADCNGDGIVDYGQIVDGTFDDTNDNGVPDCCDAETSCNGDDDGILNVPEEYPTIQVAIGVSGPGETILVQPGIYRGTGEEVVRLPEHPLQIVAASGGDVIIDGENARRCLSGAGPGLDGTVIDGLDCVAGGGVVDGGGMHLIGTSITIRNATFSGCSVSGFGGGLYDADGDNLVTGCSFVGNVAERRGGGLYLAQSTTRIEDGEFVENDVPGGGSWIGGGGVWADGGAPIFERLLIARNTCMGPNGSYHGGAGIAAVNSLPILRNCSFVENDAGGNIVGGLWNENSESMVEDCVFIANLAVDHCAVLNNTYANPSFLRCVFIGHTLETEGRFASVMLTSASPTLLTACIFRGNTGPTGSAAFSNNIPEVASTFTDCGFCGNAPVDIGSQSGNGEWIDGGGNDFARTCEFSIDCDNDGVIDAIQILEGSLTDEDGDWIPDCCQIGVECGCPADLNDDGQVGPPDLGILLALWDTDGTPNSADINGDGTVNASDLGP